MALRIVVSLLALLKFGIAIPLFFSLIGFVILLYLWFKDVVNEGLTGCHNIYVVDGFKQGILWFIFREAIFFFGVFWAFFDGALSPSVELGIVWGPIGVAAVRPYYVPLLNTTVLLTRGATGTWAHHNLLCNRNASWQLGLTVLLGVTFTGLQVYEYQIARFTITDRVYGSIFYVRTGFHGLHVLVGTIFLLVCLVRMLRYQLTSFHHVGLELAL